jgi:hypothetical protein
LKPILDLLIFLTESNHLSPSPFSGSLSLDGKNAVKIRQVNLAMFLQLCEEFDFTDWYLNQLAYLWKGEEIKSESLESAQLSRAVLSICLWMYNESFQVASLETTISRSMALLM